MVELHNERRARSAEDALLWCLRAWVVGLHHPMIEAQARIRYVLTRFGVADAAPHLDGFMGALSHAATCAINVHCVCWPHVGEDERVLLDVLALAQGSQTLEALSLLRGLVTPEGARSALRSVEEIGRVLRSAGHVLPAPVNFGPARPPYDALLH